MKFWLVLLALLAGCGGRGAPAVRATPQTIQFAAVPALTLPGVVTVSASATSGLAVGYSSTTSAICSVEATSGLVTALATGTCIIAADQSGNSEFAPAAQATLRINIIVNPVQSIRFGTAPVVGIYGFGVMSATASSGLAVGYSSLTPAICSVEAGTGVVNALAIGVCTIAADQAGNSLYYAAPQATQTVTISAWGGVATTPGAPAAVKATMGAAASTIQVGFVGPSSSGGSPVTGYVVSSVPAGLSASGTASPLTVNCPASCNGYALSISATNAIGTGTASAAVDVLTDYSVKAVFTEPATQPSDSIFTGSFTLDATTGTVSNLKGALTQSMTGPPMSTVALAYQLSAVSDGSGGLLVATFALNDTNVFSEGGFAPGSQGLYYGFPSAKNPASGGVGNAYAMIYVNLSNPLAPLTSAQINKLAYADCTALGMMGDTCMTGFSGIGTMGGFPSSQAILKR